jgi:hypothetical protein
VGLLRLEIRHLEDFHIARRNRNAAFPYRGLAALHAGHGGRVFINFIRGIIHHLAIAAFAPLVSAISTAALPPRPAVAAAAAVSAATVPPRPTVAAAFMESPPAAALPAALKWFVIVSRISIAHELGSDFRYSEIPSVSTWIIGIGDPEIGLDISEPGGDLVSVLFDFLS